MKKLLIIGILVALAFWGCDLFPKLTINDILGEWDFPDTIFNNQTIQTIHLSVLDNDLNDNECGIDLSWNNSNNFYWGSGTMKGNVFTGTYSYNITDPETNETIAQGDNQPITVTFSLNNNQLKAVFKGEGPLNGLILEHGTKAVL